LEILNEFYFYKVTEALSFHNLLKARGYKHHEGPFNKAICEAHLAGNDDATRDELTLLSRFAPMDISP